MLTWIVLGLLAGFATNKLADKTDERVVMDIVLGIVGAVASGWLFNRFGQPDVTGLNLWSFVIAVTGAVGLLILYHTATGSGARRAV